MLHEFMRVRMLRYFPLAELRQLMQLAQEFLSCLVRATKIVLLPSPNTLWCLHCAIPTHCESSLQTKCWGVQSLQVWGSTAFLLQQGDADGVQWGRDALVKPWSEFYMFDNFKFMKKGDSEPENYLHKAGTVLQSPVTS